jgi:hypothetical protein
MLSKWGQGESSMTFSSKRNLQGFGTFVVLLSSILGCRQSAPPLDVAEAPKPAEQKVSPVEAPKVEAPTISQYSQEQLAALASAEPPAAVKEVVEEYLSATVAGEIDRMANCIELPFLGTDRRTIHSLAELQPVLHHLFEQQPDFLRDRPRQVHSVKYCLLMTRDPQIHAQVDAFLDDDDWILVLPNGMDRLVVFIRVTGDRAAICAGPMFWRQLRTPIRIPEPVDSLLESAGQFELYSLEPADGRVATQGNDEKLFHGWPILGRTMVASGDDRKQLANALREATASNSGMVAFCFDPRHGIRLTHGSQTVDLLICFRCSQVETFINGQAGRRFLTTYEPQPVFDAVLSAANVPLAKPRETIANE